MKIDGPKLGLWLVVAAIIAAAFAAYTQPPRPPHPVVIHQPAPAPVVVSEPETRPTPPPVTRPAPPPVTRPAPRPKQKAKQKRRQTRFVPRPINLSPGCRDVPPEAYRHPLDVVEQAARRMGYSADRIALLRRCWHGEIVR